MSVFPTLVSIIVPTWNERENIVPLLDAVRLAMIGAEFEVLVVDDGSPDGTGAVVSDDARKHSVVRLVQRNGKKGLSSAVLEGVAHSAGAIVVMMDADFSHDPRLVPRLVREVQSGSDVVIGSRYVPGGCVEGWTFHRRIGSVMLSRFTRAVFGLDVQDPLGGFAAFRREVLEGLSTRFSERGFKLLLEVLATRPSLRVREVPITFVDRTRGKSKLVVGEIREFAILCYRLVHWRMRHRRAARTKPAS